MPYWPLSVAGVAALVVGLALIRNARGIAASVMREYLGREPTPEEREPSADRRYLVYDAFGVYPHTYAIAGSVLAVGGVLVACLGVFAR